MWCVHVPQLADGDAHAGSTNDLRRRFDSHQLGQVVPTKPHLPATLKSYVAVATERNAREFESYFKSGWGKAFARKRLW